MDIDNVYLHSASVSMQVMGIPSSAIDAAKNKLVESLKEQYPHLKPDQLMLIAFQGVTWSDPSLGCPEEGMCYPQVLTPGYVLEFGVGNDRFVVHTDATGALAAIPKFRIL